MAHWIEKETHAVFQKGKKFYKLRLHLIAHLAVSSTAKVTILVSEWTQYIKTELVRRYSCKGVGITEYKRIQPLPAIAAWLYLWQATWPTLYKPIQPEFLHEANADEKILACICFPSNIVFRWNMVVNLKYWTCMEGCGYLPLTERNW